MRFHSLLLCAVAAALSFTASPVWAGDAVPAREEAASTPVSISVRETPLRDAMRMLFQGSPLQYTVDPNVPNVPVSLTLSHVSLAGGLRIMVRQAAVVVPGLTLTRDGDVYIVKIRPAQLVEPPLVAALPAPAKSRLVTFDIRETPVRTALTNLFAGTGVELAVDPDVPNVPISLSLKDVSLQQALRLVIRQAAILAPGVMVARDGDTAVVRFIRPAR